MAGVEYIDNSKEVLAAMEAGIALALEQIGLIWLSKVTPLVPVDTSRLVHSLTYEIDLNSKQVRVGVRDVLYAAFVELGTRKMAAKPYLKPSVLNYVESYKAAVQSVLGSGWGVTVDVGSVSY